MKLGEVELDVELMRICSIAVSARGSTQGHKDGITGQLGGTCKKTAARGGLGLVSRQRQNQPNSNREQMRV